MDFQTILNFSFLLIIFILLLSFAYVGLSIAPWVPARRKDFDRINRLANLKPGQKFIELGSGEGRICRYIAKKNPEAHINGIELAVPVHILGKIISLFVRIKNMELRFGNAFSEDLSKYDVVYTFGIVKSMNTKLREKFEKELKPGAKIVSYVFAINDWQGNHIKDKPSEKDLSIHVYEKQ